jgi:hypothetical protein
MPPTNDSPGTPQESREALIQRAEALVAKTTGGDWFPGHLCNDDHSCNCRYIFGGDYMGAIGEVYVLDKPTTEEGSNDCPPLEEAKANQAFIAASRTLVPDLLSALRQDNEKMARLETRATEAEAKLRSELFYRETREREVTYFKFPPEAAWLLAAKDKWAERASRAEANLATANRSIEALRERCAKVADEYVSSLVGAGIVAQAKHAAGREIAERIRALSAVPAPAQEAPPSPTQITEQVFYGWYDDASQSIEKPTYDPRHDAPCLYLWLCNHSRGCAHTLADDGGRLRTPQLLLSHPPNL